MGAASETPPATARGSIWGVVAATLAGNLYLAVGSLALSLVAIAVAPLPPRGHLTYRVARWWARGLLAAGLVRWRVEGAETLDPAGRYVFMANHQSHFDIPALLAALPGQARFLAKRTLFRIPLFGWAIRAGGFIPVDRHDRSQARRVLLSALEHLEAGRSVVLFPEAQRSFDGRLLPFERGGFLMAMKSGLPIVPVGLDGTREVRSRGRFAIRPHPVVVRFGRPVAAAGVGLRQKHELIETVHAAVAALARVPRGPAEAGARNSAD